MELNRWEQVEGNVVGSEFIINAETANESNKIGAIVVEDPKVKN